MKLYASLGVSPLFDEQVRFVTSPLFSPIGLALIRLTLAFYTLFTATFVLVWEVVETHNAKSYLSYFTDLSYIGLCAYLWAAGVQTLFHARGDGKGYPLQSWPRPLQFLHVWLSSTAVTFPILVTIVYWSLLATTFTSTESRWSGISQHALNTVFAVFEILLTDIPPLPWSHLPLCIVILALYLGVAYITHATQGFYSYSFLNPAKEHGFLAVYIVGIAVAQCIIFALVRGIIILRTRLSNRQTQRHAVFTPETMEDWQEIDRPATPMAV